MGSTRARRARQAPVALAVAVGGCCGRAASGASWSAGRAGQGRGWGHSLGTAVGPEDAGNSCRKRTVISRMSAFSSRIAGALRRATKKRTEKRTNKTDLRSPAVSTPLPGAGCSARHGWPAVGSLPRACAPRWPVGSWGKRISARSASSPAPRDYPSSAPGRPKGPSTYLPAQQRRE